MSKSLTVIYSDDELLVVSKRAMLPTMGVVDRPDLIASVRRLLAQQRQRPANHPLHVMNRLDAPVTGLVVIALTPAAARHLTDQMHTGKMTKRYWALCDRPLEPPKGRCIDWLKADKRHRRVHVTDSTDPAAKEARLHYTTRDKRNKPVLLEVTLETGRKHQIRAQLAHRGRPILGDRKYGSQTSFPTGIALHARQVAFFQPTDSQPLCLTAPLPPYWQEYGSWD